MNIKLIGQQMRDMCSVCNRIGCWTQDEEDKDFEVCKCGHAREKRR